MTRSFVKGVVLLGGGMLLGAVIMLLIIASYHPAAFETITGYAVN